MSLSAAWLDGPWTVACPACFAKVDQPCYGARKDRSKINGYHRDRVEVWADARDRSRAIRNALADDDLQL